MNLLEAERTAEITRRMLVVFNEAVNERMRTAKTRRDSEPMSDTDEALAHARGWLEGYMTAWGLSTSIEIQDLEADEVYRAITLQDELDIRESEKALADPERTTLEDVKRELDL